YGTSSTGAASQFSYVAAPTVTGLSVTSGSTSGGTSVTVTGTNFTGLVSASFGGVPAATLTVSSSTSLTVTTPARDPGLGALVVTPSPGPWTPSAADQFSFGAPVPTIPAVSPAAGPLAGGTSVVLTGTNFTGTTAVYVGGVSATYTVNSATQITVTTPAA